MELLFLTLQKKMVLFFSSFSEGLSNVQIDPGNTIFFKNLNRMCLNLICIKGCGVCLETPPPADLGLFTPDGSNMTHHEPG